MKFLIDTHVLLWLSGDSENLLERVEQMPILSIDQAFDAYEVQRTW